MSDTVSLATAWVGAGGLAAVAVLGIAGTSIKMSAEARRQRREQRFTAYEDLLTCADQLLRAAGCTWSGEADEEDLQSEDETHFGASAEYAKLENATLSARARVTLIGTRRVGRAAVDLTNAMRTLLTFSTASGKSVDDLNAAQVAYRDQRNAYLATCRRDLKPAKVWR
jgi:hypothetical protein